MDLGGGSERVFRLEPDAITEFGKQLWRVSDSLAEIDAVGTFMEGAAACPGTDLELGLMRYAQQEHDVVVGLSADFDTFGTDLKRAVDEFVRADRESGDRIDRV